MAQICWSGVKLLLFSPRMSPPYRRPKVTPTKAMLGIVSLYAIALTLRHLWWQPKLNPLCTRDFVEPAQKGSCLCGEKKYCVCTPNLASDIIIELETPHKKTMRASVLFATLLMLTRILHTVAASIKYLQCALGEPALGPGAPSGQGIDPRHALDK